MDKDIVWVITEVNEMTGEYRLASINLTEEIAEEVRAHYELQVKPHQSLRYDLSPWVVVDDAKIITEPKDVVDLSEIEDAEYEPS